MAIQIEYYGHSCFKISCGGHTLLLDPYPADMAGYPGAKTAAGAVYCSHEHFDHNCREIVTLAEEKGTSPFAVTAINTWHDEAEGQKRGANLLHMIEVEGKRLVHCGDLGHRLAPEQCRQIGSVDVLMIPVGGFFTIDGETAAQVCRDLEAKIILPMHYREGGYGFEQISELKDFLQAMPGVPMIPEGRSIVVPDIAAEPVIVKLSL